MSKLGIDGFRVYRYGAAVSKILLNVSVPVHNGKMNVYPYSTSSSYCFVGMVTHNKPMALLFKCI